MLYVGSKIKTMKQKLLLIMAINAIIASNLPGVAGCKVRVVEVQEMVSNFVY